MKKIALLSISAVLALASNSLWAQPEPAKAPAKDKAPAKEKVQAFQTAGGVNLARHLSPTLDLNTVALVFISSDIDYDAAGKLISTIDPNMGMAFSGQAALFKQQLDKQWLGASLSLRLNHKTEGKPYKAFPLLDVTTFNMVTDEWPKAAKALVQHMCLQMSSIHSEPEINNGKPQLAYHKVDMKSAHTLKKPMYKLPDSLLAIEAARSIPQDSIFAVTLILQDHYREAFKVMYKMASKEFEDNGFALEDMDMKWFTISAPRNLDTIRIEAEYVSPEAARKSLENSEKDFEDIGDEKIVAEMRSLFKPTLKKSRIEMNVSTKDLFPWLIKNMHTLDEDVELNVEVKKLEDEELEVIKIDEK